MIDFTPATRTVLKLDDFVQLGSAESFSLSYPQRLSPKLIIPMENDTGHINR